MAASRSEGWFCVQRLDSAARSLQGAAFAPDTSTSNFLEARVGRRQEPPREQAISLDAQDPGAPSLDAVREQLQKLLASQAFRSARGQQAFLRYVVGETIAGRGHQLKESLIGMEAFGRGESFDPRLDPIVRTQAAKLRARLTRYYETEGAEDALRIEFRKGSYVPLFRRKGASAKTPMPTEPAVPAVRAGLRTARRT
jgi:hypothetical protein